MSTDEWMTVAPAPTKKVAKKTTEKPKSGDKTSPCTNFFGDEGKCPYGKKCRFSHDPKDCDSALKIEKKPNPGYKTAPCTNFFGDEGKCPYGDKCHFSHDPEVFNFSLKKVASRAWFAEKIKEIVLCMHPGCTANPVTLYNGGKIIRGCGNQIVAVLCGCPGVEQTWKQCVCQPKFLGLKENGSSVYHSTKMACGRRSITETHVPKKMPSLASVTDTWVPLPTLSDLMEDSGSLGLFQLFALWQFEQGLGKVVTPPKEGDFAPLPKKKPTKSPKKTTQVDEAVDRHDPHRVVIRPGFEDEVINADQSAELTIGQDGCGVLIPEE